MKRFACGSMLSLIATTLSAVTISAQGTPTMSNPGPRQTMTPPAVAAPTLSIPAASFLHGGAYQLRLHFAPNGDSASAFTKTLDVKVATSGNVVTITSANPTDMLRGTIQGTAFTASGSSSGISLSVTATATAAGASGTFVTSHESNTAQGTMALTRAHTAQLHKIEQFGSKTVVPLPPRSWWQDLKDWFWP